MGMFVLIGHELPHFWCWLPHLIWTLHLVWPPIACYRANWIQANGLASHSLCCTICQAAICLWMSLKPLPVPTSGWLFFRHPKRSLDNGTSYWLLNSIIWMTSRLRGWSWEDTEVPQYRLKIEMIGLGLFIAIEPIRKYSDNNAWYPAYSKCYLYIWFSKSNMYRPAFHSQVQNLTLNNADDKNFPLHQIHHRLQISQFWIFH